MRIECVTCGQAWQEESLLECDACGLQQCPYCWVMDPRCCAIADHANGTVPETSIPCECRGSGVLPIPGECPECAGSCVQVLDGVGAPCPDCEGTGWIEYSECRGCSPPSAPLVQKLTA